MRISDMLPSAFVLLFGNYENPAVVARFLQECLGCIEGGTDAIPTSWAA